MTSTAIAQHVKAPRGAVYQALLDAAWVQKWRVPSDMSSHVHEFDPREGGSFRVSLTYRTPTRAGKTTAHTDTYYGRFVRLIPDEQVVEAIEFETTDPTLAGEMTVTTTLTDAMDGTDILVMHDGLPKGVSPADNEMGTRMALAKLAAMLEARQVNSPGD